MTWSPFASSSSSSPFIGIAAVDYPKVYQIFRDHYLSNAFAAALGKSAGSLDNNPLFTEAVVNAASLWYARDNYLPTVDDPKYCKHGATFLAPETWAEWLDPPAVARKKGRTKFEDLSPGFGAET